MIRIIDRIVVRGNSFVASLEANSKIGLMCLVKGECVKKERYIDDNNGLLVF